MNHTIIPIEFAHAEGFRSVLDTVAREKIYLARTRAPSLKQVQDFVADNIRNENPQYVALRSRSEVVGWCDIVRLKNPITCHTGILGMGIAPDARGAGLGSALLKATLEAAWSRKFVRVELTVFAHNTGAIALYKKAGFAIEGEMIDAARFDDGYVNSYIMGLVRH